jgi:predicted naringenin-chalcone synthase
MHALGLKDTGMDGCLVDFTHIRPPHEFPQEELLGWIAEAHSRAEAKRANWTIPCEEYQQFHSKIKEKLLQLGLGKEKIQKRGAQIGDPKEDNWVQMPLYPVDTLPNGVGFSIRSTFFDQAVSSAFQKFYQTIKKAPSHLIHVTCTGYVAPSPAQRLISTKGWGEKTTITHAYHMGCYASIPAIRMGMGFLQTLPSPSPHHRADIVHTELCSLHMNPANHAIDQLVVQSLFADGYIKYSAMEESAAKKRGTPYCKLLTLHEEMIADSLKSMTWRCEDWGLGMSIAKEVPVLITRALPAFIKRLRKKGKVLAEGRWKQSLFAIHPGGPKILQQVKELLNLSQEQIFHSQKVLQDFGNMSSATLPHIWQKILEDPHVKTGTLIISLAVGPGLSLSGGIFEKR